VSSISVFTSFALLYIQLTITEITGFSDSAIRRCHGNYQRTYLKYLTEIRKPMKLKDDATRKTDVNPKLCETTPPRREPITDERLTTDVIRPAAAALSQKFG